MKYECKDNDVIIELSKDKSEIYVFIEGDNCGKTVVGLNDINKAMISFGFGEYLNKNKKQEIINILKQFEQRDYKKGGVSIAPDNYNAIANNILRYVVSPETVAKEHFRKQRDEGVLELHNIKNK